VRRFRKKKFFASKRNEAKQDPFRMRFARSREKKKTKFFFASFCFKFFAPDQSEINSAFFRFVSLTKIFRFASKRNEINVFFASFHHTRYRHKKVKDQPSYFSLILYKLSQNFTLSFFALKFSLLFRFVFASFHFFASRQKKFASISLRSENDGSFSLSFCFISLRSEKDGSFLLPFRFISLRSENDGSFLLLFRFVFASFHFRFASDLYVSHRCETSEKALFFPSKRKKFRFRFASFRFILLQSENDGAP
jgi:hypothetical protein